MRRREQPRYALDIRGRILELPVFGQQRLALAPVIEKILTHLGLGARAPARGSQLQAA